ncbi:MAG: peptidylprolyl isomerase [Elusimicrobiota bacterium]|nr:peptidylprolyl isomerase [Elusimicrobiota bacterium]
MKKIIFAMAALFMSLPVSARMLDRIVATVNGKAIFYSEFTERIKPFQAQIENNASAEEAEKLEKRVKKEILDAMIEEKVLLIKAGQENMQVTESEVDQGIAEIRARFKTEDEYAGEIKKQGLSVSKMRENIKNQLVTIKLINRDVRSKIPEPSEKEMKKFYEANEDKMIVGEQVKVKQIFFEFKKGVSKKELKSKAKRVLAEAKKKKASFSELAEKYSSVPENAGDTGYFGRGEKIPEFENPCFNLNVGGISGVFETPLGYHIVKCTGKNAPEKKTFEEARDYIKNYLYSAAMEAKYTAWVRDLRDQAAIKILDKKLFE